MINWVN
jgi:hypothetical protein